jgi:hypothetical protein
MIMKVGKVFGDPPKRFRYEDIPLADSRSWIDVDEYLPKDYDLVDLKLANGKLRKGWLQLGRWEALNLKKTDQVWYWRTIEEKTSR